MGYCSIECEWFVFIKLHMTSLIHEYLALCRQLAKVQERCSAVMAEQAARTEGLERANLLNGVEINQTHAVRKIGI